MCVPEWRRQCDRIAHGSKNEFFFFLKRYRTEKSVISILRTSVAAVWNKRRSGKKIAFSFRLRPWFDYAALRPQHNRTSTRTFAPHTHNITIILNELYFNLRRVRGAIIRRSFFFLVTKKKNTVFFFSKYFRNKKPFEKRNAASAEKRRRRSKSYKCKKKKKSYVTSIPIGLQYNINSLR